MKISDFIERKITLILLEKDVKHNTVNNTLIYNIQIIK